VYKNNKNTKKDENLPKDIYYNKLLEWLIDRRHCDAKWQVNVSSIREKINTAIQDMPQNEEITTLLAGTYINYFHCEQIISLLKKCGEGNTNFFGQYSSKRMKDWQEVINIYETDNNYLAESSHMLMRNVNYEIPALKRQINKCQQTQRECSRKENDCNINAVKYKQKYLHTCKQMGITGDKVRKELVQLVDELPNIFSSIAEKTKTLSKVVAYYETFVKFVTNNDKVDICMLIKFIMEHGNATVYQWKTGEAPSKIVADIQTVDLAAMTEMTSDLPEDQQEVEIDWGASGDAIDFGDDSAIDFGETAEIDFGDDNEIDFGDTENLGDIITVEEAGLENPEGGIATGNEAMSVMDNHATRNIFIDELMEVLSFLEQRLVEMSVEADMITINQFQSAPSLIQHQSKENIQTMLSTVSSVLNEFNSMKMQNLCLIKSSPRYVDRIADSLEQKLKISTNLLHQINTLQQRSKEALELQGKTEPKLSIIVKKTKELQVQMEKEISKRYKGRKVNIMGEINTI